MKYFKYASLALIVVILGLGTVKFFHPEYTQVKADVIQQGTESFVPTLTPAPIPTVTQIPTPSATSPSGWYYVFVAPDAYYKIQGSSIRFTGSHFIPGETVSIRNENGSVGSAVANSNGTFTTNSFTVPYGLGMKTYTFTGNTSNLSFPVGITVGNGNPWIVLDNYYAGSGSSITISGHQFGGNEQISLTFSGVNVGSAMTDENGNFNQTITVPTTGQGQMTITAHGQTTGLSASQSFSEAF